MDFCKFKRCPGCKTWFSVKEIMESPAIEPIGMVLEVKTPNINLYYFNHACLSCGTTFAIPVVEFEPLVPATAAQKILAGESQCERHCLTLQDRSSCQQECVYAPYRKLLRKMMMARGISLTDSSLKVNL